MDLESICKQTVEVVKEVGEYIRSARKSSITVEEKSINSLVTQVDKSAEKQLIEKLSTLVPEAGIIGEEGMADKKSEELNWIIDPLDGTTNFIHNLPCYSISVALVSAEEILIGMVYEINLSECFYAWKDGGAYLNKQPIKVSENHQLKDALLATGFPYYDYERMDEYMDLFREFMKTSRGLRRLGSAAVDLAYVACGRFDGFYEYSLNAWDVAAGALLVQEAGGKVSDFSGEADYLFGREIIASSSNIYIPFFRTIQHFF